MMVAVSPQYMHAHGWHLSLHTMRRRRVSAESLTEEELEEQEALGDEQGSTAAVSLSSMTQHDSASGSILPGGITRNCPKQVFNSCSVYGMLVMIRVQHGL